MANHTLIQPVKTSSSQASKAERNLKKIFYNLTLLKSFEQEEGALMGYVHAIENPLFVVNFMDRYVRWRDSILDRIPEGTAEYAREFGKRGFSYTEFLLVTTGSIKEENYGRHRVFQYLYLYDQDDCGYFAIEHSEDGKTQMERYVIALGKWARNEIPELGKFLFFTKIPFRIALKHYKKHAYILSQSGTGKSELMKLIFYDLQRMSKDDNSKSLVLLEPHGDLSQEVLMFAFNKHKRKRVVYLDPFIRETAQSLLGEDVLGEDYTFILNPFDLKSRTDKEISYLTDKLSTAFFEIIESEETFQMEAIIEACVETLLRSPGSTIADLKRFMDDKQNQDLVEIGKSIPNVERANLMQTRFRSDGKILTTKGSVYYRLQKLLGNSEFRRLLVGESTIDLEKELNSGKVIICNISKGRLGSAANAFGKLFIALILGYVTKRQDIPKAQRKDTFLFIDEFHNFITPSIEEVMAETRKYALHATLSHQVMGQNMSVELKRLIAGNTAIKIAGQNEPESLSWMAKQMKHLEVTQFDELPEYSFYVNNKFNKKAGTFLFRVPDFLVKQQPPYYMSRAELKDFFLYIANESGYYRKVQRIALEETAVVRKIYKPDFLE